MNKAPPHEHEGGSWQVWIDTGGTFTDCIARDPERRLHRCKVLSSGALRDRVERIESRDELVLRGASNLPRRFLTGFHLARLGSHAGLEIVEHDAGRGMLRLATNVPPNLQAGTPVELHSGEEAPLLAARLVTATPRGEPLPPIAMRLATTRGTNALLERRGARSVLFVTAGFEDLLEIGTQQRPDLFALHIDRPAPLPEKIVGVAERLAVDGEVLVSLDTDSLREAIARLHHEGIRCAGIALLHGHRNPIHEELIEELLREAGFDYIARSSVLCPSQGLLRRSQTCAVDSYLGPVIGGYLEAVSKGLGSGRKGLHVMTSAGGLVEARSFRPKDSLLSGPAGGVVGAALAGRRCGLERIIAFDMGGTSTDVARFDGDFAYVFEHTVGPVELAAPALAIETVAAGGGSVCRVEQGHLAVGPESAGAQPGPACYGAGGPLTLTDVNVLLGRLRPERLPIPIDAEASHVRLQDLVHTIEETDPVAPGKEETLEGLLEIADERMAEAIRRISVREGIDPTGYALVAFGGAGGQHACRVADLLGMEQVLMPADSGLLSAFGLGHAVIERFAQREILRPLAEVEDRLEPWLTELEGEAASALVEEGVQSDQIDRPRRIAQLRYLGQDASLEIEPGPDTDLGSEFDRRYFELFSYQPRDRDIELVSLRVVTRSKRRATDSSGEIDSEASTPQSAERYQRCFLDGKWQEIACFEAESLVAGVEISGPALIQQAHSALVMPSGWFARVLEGRDLRLSRGDSEDGDTHERFDRPRPRAVELELMSHRFASIAREMGEMLRRTAVSTNIKERMDFSCTLLDPQGRLVVNAPHIPVHLGAMGLCVRTLVEHHPVHAGDVVVTNHPAFGGSHLPDVTLVAPVHLEGRHLGYVACRAHHAELGGIQPGSMPPRARSLAEEAVVLPPTALVEGGAPHWDRIERLLCRGPHPTRALADNLADLRAMLAAVARGGEALLRLAESVGLDHVIEHMEALRQLAARQVEAALSGTPDGDYDGFQLLDDGSPLAARFTVKGARAVLDFAGSAPVHSGNLNATPAIVQSVTMYVMRLLIDVDLPLNDGLLDPLELRIPAGILNPPFTADPNDCPAIVGGNVETSQRLTDTLLQALGLAACSQGTMNNLSFGNARFGYYETVGGGSGAVEGFAGAGGVHTHMTNTRITDPEVLEHRYPVRLHRFALRRGSGGAGRWPGGDGLVREIEFLAPLSVAILSQHRQAGPYGMAGGETGAPGRQTLVRADGERRELAPIDGCDVVAGDRIVLETPGGGGFGIDETRGSE
ncbi:MAG: hydantoinase B/oxoprolinase family protein [Thermoanaerobaculales bacterium]